VSEQPQPGHPRLESPLFHIVLHQPEIPNNTGNIGRTCVAVGATLHLVRPLGFSTSEKACRRAGLDYWPRLDVREHDSWPDYTAADPAARRWLFSTKARRTVFDAQLRRGDHLVFGKETAGLPDDLLAEAGPDRVLGLPMAAGERSLNVATAVCAAAYEGIRQLIAGGAVLLGPDGRLIP
jgi:tRNA (cytidine/uridine-2'-O-)-methyltransferase